MDRVKETIDTYDLVAESYKQRYLSTNDKNHMQPLLDEFLNYVNEGKNILDVGSGAGFDAKYLSDHGCKVISIDLSEGLLKVAKEIAPEVEFLKMDMRSMNFENDSFDGVWASASLLHIPKDEVRKVLSEIYRVIKPQSIFFVAVKQGEGETFVINEGEGNLSGARRFFAYYQKNEMIQLLENTGFKLIEFKSNTNRENVWLNFYVTKNLTD